MKRHFPQIASFSLLAVGVLLGHADRATAQNNSLFAAEQQQSAAISAATPADSTQPLTSPAKTSRVSATPAGTAKLPGPMTLAETSWTYQAAAEPRIVKLNDIVKVTVAVKSSVTSQGSIDRKKTGYGSLTLTNWIKFYGGNLGENGGANGQPPYGTPSIRGDVDNQLQANGNLQTQDKMSFTISCRIVDKRPNGNCILEGTWSVRDNEENWEYALSGEIRPEDIKPDNSIVSDTIADLKIVRREAGHVRDSYRRGWALEWLDKWQPF